MNVATYSKAFRTLHSMKQSKPKKDVMLRIRISQELKDRVEKEAQQRGISVSELIRKRLVRRPYGSKGSEESTGRE
jgi:predicted HicB family RNase H-like nuclease